MYLIDTNVISEARKKARANPGVIRFFDRAEAEKRALYLSVISVGELQRGVDLIRHRGDITQADLLENWLRQILDDYASRLLPFDQDTARVWGRLRVLHPEHAIDKQIAATALVNDLVLVTRNVDDFSATGVALTNPFS